jgi:hypothetical protein
MFEYLVFSQVPGQPAQQPAVPQQPSQPAQPAPGAQPAQQPSAQPAPGAQPAQQPSAQPAAQPAGPAPAGGGVSMMAMLQWAGIGGAASGAIQAVFGVITGFEIVNFLMTVGIAVVVGILVAIILGQFGAKIPIKATLMIKAALFMFVINLIPGFIFGMGVGTLGMILGIIGVGAGAFAYGWLVQNKLPNLI